MDCCVYMVNKSCPDSRSLVSTGSDFICTLSNDSVLLSLTCVAFLSGVNRGVGCRDSSLLRSGVNDSRRLLQRSDMELDSLALRSLITGSLSVGKAWSHTLQVNTALTVEFEAAVAAAATLALVASFGDIFGLLFQSNVSGVFGDMLAAATAAKYGLIGGTQVLEEAEASAKSPDDGGDVVCRELGECACEACVACCTNVAAAANGSAAAAAGANVAGNGRPTGGVFGVGVCADVLLLSLPEQCDSLDGHRPSGAFKTELLDSRDWQRGLASSLQ
uniref:Uncharacterized protein n=1 Tax=Glossina austeni TaxID=7395 RepID=A0A1A9UYV6_GLOAU